MSSFVWEDLHVVSGGGSPPASETIRTTDIRTWQRCRRKYTLLKKFPVGDSQLASLGTRVHALLEAYYKDEPPPDPPLTIPPEDENLAQIMFAGYLEWLETTGVDEGMEVLGVEVPLELQLQSGTITGKADLIVRQNGMVWILDHKTVGTLTPPRMIAMDHQLQTYVLMAREAGFPAVGAGHNMLRRVKRTGSARPPYYGRELVTFSNAQLESHRANLELLVAEIRNAPEDVAMIPTATRDCGWDCPFADACVLGEPAKTLAAVAALAGEGAGNADHFDVFG